MFQRGNRTLAGARDGARSWLCGRRGRSRRGRAAIRFGRTGLFAAAERKQSQRVQGAEQGTVMLEQGARDVRSTLAGLQGGKCPVRKRPWLSTIIRSARDSCVMFGYTWPSAATSLWSAEQTAALGRARGVGTRLGREVLDRDGLGVGATFFGQAGEPFGVVGEAVVDARGRAAFGLVALVLNTPRQTRIKVQFSVFCAQIVSAMSHQG